MKKLFPYFLLIASTTISLGCTNIYHNIPKASETSQKEFTKYGYPMSPNNFDQTITFLTKRIAINSSDTDALIQRGIAYRAIGKHKESLKDLSRAIEINEKLANAYFYRGNAKSDLERYESAIEDYNKATLINPKLIDAYLSKGKALMNLSKYDEAILEINRAINLDNSYGLSFNDRGIIQERMNNQKGACNDWKAAVALGYSPSQKWLDMSCQ